MSQKEKPYTLSELSVAVKDLDYHRFQSEEASAEYKRLQSLANAQKEKANAAEERFKQVSSKIRLMAASLE